MEPLRTNSASALCASAPLRSLERDDDVGDIADRGGKKQMPARLDRSLIAGTPAFRGLAPDDLDRILAHARAVRFPKDIAIFEQDAEARSFFLLLSGHVRVVRTSPEGHKVIARYINEGELFGIAVAMNRNTYPASAITAVDCVALTWPNGAWAPLRERYPAFGANAYRTIGERLQDSQDRVMEMSSEQVEQRVAGAILRLARQSGRATGAGIEIDFPITRQDIAEMTGTTLHTVSRLVSAWEDAGYVKGGRQKVVVADPNALLLISENRKPR
jgi:CRP-like cAMP-binding protein